MKALKQSRPVLSVAEVRRRGREWLAKIQLHLMPEHANEDIAIDIDDGKYVLESESEEDVLFAFRDKWPRATPYVCRVNGRPSIRL